MSENRFLKQAKEELAYLSSDPDFQRLVEARAGFLKDVYHLEQKGLRNGRLEEKIAIAQKMKEKNKPIDEIIDFTGLSKEEIEKL